jgi:hypothetical protein
MTHKYNADNNETLLLSRDLNAARKKEKKKRKGHEMTRSVKPKYRNKKEMEDDKRNNTLDPSSLGFGVNFPMESKEDKLNSFTRKQQRNFFTESMNKLKIRMVTTPRTVNQKEEGDVVSIHHTCTRNEKPSSRNNRNSEDPIRMVKDEEVQSLIQAFGLNVSLLIGFKNYRMSKCEIISTMHHIEYNTIQRQDLLDSNVPSYDSNMNTPVRNNVSHDTNAKDEQIFSTRNFSSDISIVSKSLSGKGMLNENEDRVKHKPRDWKDECIVGLVKNVDYYFADVPPSIPFAAVCCLVTTCLTL